MNRSKKRGIINVDANKELKKQLTQNGTFEETKYGVKLSNDNDESRQELDACPTLGKLVLNPIIDWSHNDIWEFIKKESISYCSLYDDGWTRIGCIGCPMASKKNRENHYLRWPKYKKAYLRALEKMLQVRKERELKTTWNTAIDVFNWWMEYDTLPGQIDWLEEQM